MTSHNATTMTRRPPLTPDDEARLEREAVAVFERLEAAREDGSWQPSPVEETDRLIREALLRTPGRLRAFRRSFLAAGRLNFPDSPEPKEHFLRWGDTLPSRVQRWRGMRQLLRMVMRMRSVGTIRLRDLDDRGPGQPSVFALPMSFAALGAALAGAKGWRERPDVCRLTETQTRGLYYRLRLLKLIGTNPGPILEIGGGYGGLATEVLQHLPTPRYIMVDLPDALPLAYYHMRASFDCEIQVLARRGDVLNPDARIVLAAPWMLPEISTPVGLAINTMSFQHMARANLDYYFAQIDRLGARRIYTVNRDTRRDSTDVPISEYPVPARFTTVHNRPWLFGAHPERVFVDQSAGE